jgi:hypothetical protein
MEGSVKVLAILNLLGAVQVRMYRSAKVVSDLSDFQRFNTEGKQEGAPRP